MFRSRRVSAQTYIKVPLAEMDVNSNGIFVSSQVWERDLLSSHVLNAAKDTHNDATVPTSRWLKVAHLIKKFPVFIETESSTKL
jgi:hypothetical protein